MRRWILGAGESSHSGVQEARRAVGRAGRAVLFAISVILATAAFADSLAPEQRRASARYVNGLENADGGFRASEAAGRSELKNMPAATRAIHYFGSGVAHEKSVVNFVRALYDPAAGAFHEPGATADVRSTAMGAMTLAELGQRLGSDGPAIARYFDANATGQADVYIAEAALQANGLRPLREREWLQTFEAMRHTDGTYGKDVTDTAHAVVTYLRLKARLPDRAGATRALRAAQNWDGGFGVTPMSSDLPTSYPVMRALYMLKTRPDIAAIREFVGRCRNDDGGYGPTAGQPSTVGATYYAAIILHWLDEMEKQP